MSIGAMTSVGDLNLPTNLKFVLLKYADCADDHGRDTWPSHERVARYTGLSVKTVQRAVAYFRACGVLVAQAPGEAGIGGRGKRGKGVAYTVDIKLARDLFGYWEESRAGAVTLIGGRQDGAKTPDTVTGVSAVDEPLNPGQGDRGIGGETLDTATGVLPVDKSANPGHGDRGLGGETLDTQDLNPGHPGPKPRTLAGRNSYGNCQKPRGTFLNHPEPSKRARATPSARGDGDARADQQASDKRARPWDGLDAKRLARAVAVRRAERGSTMRLSGITETERKAAEAYLQAVERGEIEDPTGRAQNHACDVWRGNIARLRAVLGEAPYNAWIAGLTPIADDGEVLELACAAPSFVTYVKENFGEAIEETIGRRIVLRVTRWADAAAAKRRAAGGWTGDGGTKRGGG